MVVFFCCSSSHKEESEKSCSVAEARSSLSHCGKVAMCSAKVSHGGVRDVSRAASGGIGGTEHRRDVGVSRRTVTGTASGGGRES